MEPKFDIPVRLIGQDGNAFAIIGRVTRAMRNNGCTSEDVNTFLTEATSGDYDHLLRTVMATVVVE